MSPNEHDTPESGTLPGRHEWIVEPDGPMSVPENPEWNRPSDNMRSFSASPGANVERRDGIGTADATGHDRGPEEPEASVSYDMQRFPVSSSGEPQTLEAYGILRDEHNQLLGTILYQERTEIPGGNDGAGIRLYTVVRGAAVESAEPTLDPSGAEPILMETDLQPRKVRSHAIHQPAAGTTLELVSTEDADTMDVTIENEDAGTTETIALDGTTPVTTTESFGDIDAVWLDDGPAGDVTITDGSGTTIMELLGGLTHSDDDQPVAGDQGVPALGGGSHAAPINESYEHFVGDKVERPLGSPIRPRLNSAGWSVENSLETDTVHTSRQPTIDVGNRTVQVEADVAGPAVSHDSMMEALAKHENDIGHELSGGSVVFRSAPLVDDGDREREADDQAAVSISETFECNGDPPIELFPGETLEEVLGA